MVDTSPGYSENIVADKAFADLGAVVATFFSLVIRQEGDIHKTSVIFQVKSILKCHLNCNKKIVTPTRPVGDGNRPQPLNIL